ncbi:MAG: hypothetical protein J7518_11560 [Nocardioidaceae bacterium]|nr:hypothetical protein [Nocardioidaceae bacterium]
MGEHLRTRKRGHRRSLRTLVLTGVVAAAVTFAGPASALLGITLPIPSGGNPTTPITIGGSLTGPGDDVPNASLDLSGLNASVDGLLGLTNISGGLTQTTTTLTQLLQGLQTGAAVAAPVVQAHATEATATAIANLTSRAQATTAAAAALDPATATAELTGILTDLQGQALGEVAGLLPLALTTGLQVVQNIVTPVCSLTAIPSSFLPGIGLDTTRTYISALPVIQQTDAATNQLLRDTYANLYDDTLASVNNIPNVGPIAGALLTLLKYNWTSSYTPPGSSTPIVTTTKALMNVPTPIDVDHDGLFDLCGTTSFAFTGSGTSITGLKFTQTLTKMPLAKPVLPVDITGGLLNVINFGYDTTESTVPIVYTTSATLDGSSAKLNVDNNYAVHRGTNLTIPPVILQDLNLLTGGLPTFPTLLTPAPKPIVTQKVCIGACSGLAIKYRFENVPTATHVDSPLASLGVNVNYTGAQASDSFGYRFGLGSIGLGTVVGADRAAAGSTPARVFAAPTAARSCFSLTDATCSTNASDKYTIGFSSSAPTSVDDDITLSGSPTADCAGIGSTNAQVRLSDTDSFHLGAIKGGSAVSSGRLAIDTGGDEVDGCAGSGSLLALTGIPSLTLPTGFKASNRVATYHQANILTAPTPDTKTGTITCPAGTAASYVTPLSANLQPVICFLPPANTTAPSISGSATVDSTLTANNGAWTPPAPNAPSFTRQWNKCDSSGGSCQPITGATGSTYVLDYGSYPNEPTDFGHRFTVTVTGTNLDGSATATSAPTDVVVLPPPPANTVPPVLGSNRKVGVATTTTNGTWNPGASSFAYQWQRCLDSAGLICADIAGATGSTYVLQSADKYRWIRVGIVATNHGGSSAVVYSNTGYVPGDPVNTTPPGIKNGPANAVGVAVATGDNLAATPGTWVDTNAPFTYQWQRCDAGGNGCTDIGGATGATYGVQHPADDGGTLRVAVTGHGLNGDTTAYSGTTGVVLFNDLSAKPVTQIPDGTVNATVAGASTTTYVGGSFDTVGAPTGGSGLVPDSGTGSTVSLASATAGAANGGVMATVPDGSGGYFMGGSFTQVKGIGCPGLAHLLSDGSVDQTYCFGGLTGTVRSLARMTGGISKVLVVGGDFSLGGRQNLMFLDPAAPGSPVFLSGGDPNGAVKALATNNSNNNVVYTGGQFNQAGGTNAGNLAGVQLTWTGTQLSSAARNGWLAAVCIGTPATTACGNANASVNTLAWLSTGVVLAGGRFDTQYRANASGTPSNATTRNNVLMMSDNGNAGVNGWNPNVGGGNQTVNAIALGAINGLNNVPIYLGGDFTTIAGQNIKNLGEFGSTVLGTSAGSGGNNNSGPMTTWVPAPNGPVTSLAWAGSASSSTLIVGGAFTAINTGPAGSPTTLVRHRLAKINLASSNGSTLPAVDASWDPNAGRTVRTVSRDATLGTVTVGGDFLVLGGKTRNNLAELDPNTGVTGWNPGTDGTVNALAFRGGTVYAGGSFANAGGAARANLAAIDGASGTATGWNPGANGTVSALATDASNVYAGGAFSTAGGASRASLAALDGSGTATGWNPGTDGTVKALAVDAGTVYVGGSFGTAGGAARANAAGIDGSGNATGFNPAPNGAVNSVAVNSAGVYLGGAFTAVGPDGRAHVALVDPASGAAAGWNPGTDGTVNALFLVGSQVFVGGQFANAGGVGRSNLAALDAGSDAALSFNAAPNGAVNALSRTSGGSIAVGGAFTIIAGQAAPALGFFGG